MEKLVLEVHTRSLNQYHKLERFPVRVGRALDNDIILSDAAISPHHLLLERDEAGQVFVQNLSQENGTKLNGKKLAKGSKAAINAPARLRLANRRTRLLKETMDVAQTQMSVCRGLFALLCHPIGVGILAMLAVFLMSFKGYMDSGLQQESLFSMGGVIPSVLFLALVTVIAAGITRFATNRWEFLPALGFASLFIIIPHLLLILGHWSAYLLTENWPMDLTNLISKLVILPLLLFIYLKRVHYSHSWQALGMALVVSAPVLIYQVSSFIDDAEQEALYSGNIEFSRTLSSLDMRLANTKSQESFLQDVGQALQPESATNKE